MKRYIFLIFSPSLGTTWHKKTSDNLDELTNEFMDYFCDLDKASEKDDYLLLYDTLSNDVILCAFV